MAVLNFLNIPNSTTIFQDTLYVTISAVGGHSLTPEQLQTAYDTISVVSAHTPWSTRNTIGDALRFDIDLLSMIPLGYTTTVEISIGPLSAYSPSYFKVIGNYSTSSATDNTGITVWDVLPDIYYWYPTYITVEYTEPTTTTSTTSTTTATTVAPTTTPSGITTSTTTTAPLTASTTGTREPSVLATVTAEPTIRIPTSTPVPELTLTGLTTQPPQRPTTTRARHRTTLTTQLATRSPMSKSCPMSNCNTLNF